MLPCSKLRSFGSKCTVLKKALVTLLGLFGAPHSDSASGEWRPLDPIRYAPGHDVRCVIRHLHRISVVYDQNTPKVPTSFRLLGASSSSFERVVTVHCLATRSRGRSSAAIRWSHHTEPLGDAVHGMVDGLAIGGHNDRQFVLLRHTHSHTTFAQAERERPTPVRRWKPNPHCSRKGHFRRVGAGTADESKESRSVVQPLHIPLVIRPERRTYVVVVR